MAIPTIEPYALPEIGANRAGWRVDPDRAVLLVHDMQNYFLDPFRGDPLSTVIDNIRDLRKLAADRGIPVVYTAQPGAQDPADRALLTDFWGPGVPADPRATAIVDALAPTASDTVLTKWRYSAFVRTPLMDVLAGRDQLLITGVYAHIGIQVTACDAFMRDIRPFVIGDAVADFSARRHSDALTYVAQRCGMVVSTEGVLS